MRAVVPVRAYPHCSSCSSVGPAKTLVWSPCSYVHTGFIMCKPVWKEGSLQHAPHQPLRLAGWILRLRCHTSSSIVLWLESHWEVFIVLFFPNVNAFQGSVIGYKFMILSTLSTPLCMLPLNLLKLSEFFNNSQVLLQKTSRFSVWVDSCICKDLLCGHWVSSCAF